MEKRLKVFFHNLVTHFSNQEDLYHVYSDEASDPTVVNIMSPLKLLSPEIEAEFNDWLSLYLYENTEVHYYEMYKQLMSDFFNLCVNPTSEELEQYSSESFEVAESHLFQKMQRKLVEEYVSKDYEVVLGSQLIDRLIRLYDVSAKLTPLTEWLDSFDIASLDNQEYYIVDFDFFTKPEPLTEEVIMERANQEFPITPLNLYLYFENLIVTKRGLESKEAECDTKIVFEFYCDMDHYLERNCCEMKETTLRRLMDDAVDPNRPFVESIVENVGEIYINLHALHTEKDLLDFVNMAYELEEVDREAKSFNRSQIINHLVTKKLSKNGHVIYY